jgi:hypothetical protein
MIATSTISQNRPQKKNIDPHQSTIHFHAASFHCQFTGNHFHMSRQKLASKVHPSIAVSFSLLNFSYFMKKKLGNFWNFLFRSKNSTYYEFFWLIFAKFSIWKNEKKIIIILRVHEATSVDTGYAPKYAISGRTDDSAFTWGHWRKTMIVAPLALSLSSKSRLRSNFFNLGGSWKGETSDRQAVPGTICK